MIVQENRFCTFGFFMPVLALFGLVLVLTGGLLYRHIINSRSQKTKEQNNTSFSSSLISFNDTHYPYSFTYPKGWFLEKLDSPGVFSTVNVSNFKDSCNKCTNKEKNSYTEFYIQRDETISNNSSYKTAKEYILAKEQQFNNEEGKRRREYKNKTGKDMIPTSPGFTQKYVQESNLIHLSGVSIAEVGFYHYTPDLVGDYLSNKEYVLLVNYTDVYTIDLIKPKIISSESQQALNKIIYSLRFK